MPKLKRLTPVEAKHVLMLLDAVAASTEDARNVQWLNTARRIIAASLGYVRDSATDLYMPGTE